MDYIVSMSQRRLRDFDVYWYDLHACFGMYDDRGRVSAAVYAIDAFIAPSCLDQWTCLQRQVGPRPRFAVIAMTSLLGRKSGGVEITQQQGW